VPANRKTRVRTDAAPSPDPVVEAPQTETPVESPGESRPRTEGKRAKGVPPRHKKQHGTAYRWIRAYMPILAGLFALLAALWIYTGFINPPPPTPAQQWTKIANIWSPAREKARLAVAADTLDFAKQQADYKDFYTQTKGWVTAVSGVKDWGVAAQDVTTFLSDGQSYVTTLQQVTNAKTAYDVTALSATLSQLDSTFTADVSTVVADFALPATSPLPSALALPSVNATPTPTPGPSGSAGPSGSPSATTATPPATPTAAPPASAAVSPSPS
jgi:hypothetical protein